MSVREQLIRQAKEISDLKAEVLRLTKLSKELHSASEYRLEALQMESDRTSRLKSYIHALEAAMDKIYRYVECGEQVLEPCIPIRDDLYTFVTGIDVEAIEYPKEVSFLSEMKKRVSANGYKKTMVSPRQYQFLAALHLKYKALV